MVKPFADAAFALPDSGSISQSPVESQFGFHLIKLLGKRTTPLMEPAQARSMLTESRQIDAFKASYNLLIEQVVIRLNEDLINVDLNDSTS